MLSLEAEPRASAGDSRTLAEFLALAHPEVARLLVERDGFTQERAETLAKRHLGTCLDCCHSAVEFENPAEALALAGREGPLGKLQFTSAVALRGPGADAQARLALLDMDEPRYLHQVTGRRGVSRQVVDDLPELAAVLAGGGSDWLDCDEWRCHFHVPVDLEHLGPPPPAPGAHGLATTRAHADAILARCLAAPERWTTRELHVEIETYTWDVLPGSARGAGELVDGLEREYAHVMGILESAGWKRG